MLDFEWSGVRFTLVKCSGACLMIVFRCTAIPKTVTNFISFWAERVHCLLISANIKCARAISLLPAGVKHSQVGDKNNPLSDIYIYIQTRNLQKQNSFAKMFLETHFFYHQQFETECASQILSEIKEKKPGWESAAAGLMINLLTRITRLYAPADYSAPEKDENLNDMRFLIIENMFLYNKDFTLKDLSRKLGVCERQTQRLLKKYYGKTFREKVKESSQ